VAHVAIHYYCRHCKTKIGTLDADKADAKRLGFHLLTEEERMEMIRYDPSGNVIVRCICEDCQESLQRNPNFYANDYIIH
jgi:hypothetical protein